MLTETQLFDLFRSIVRREPTKAEIDAYSDLSTEAEATEAIITAEGAGTGRVATYYQIFFNRLPDAGGLDFWTGTVNAPAGFGDAALANAFFQAGEFETLYGDLPTADAVAEIYRNVLGREPDDGGLAFWTGQVLDRPGFGLRELGLAFAQAPETGTTFAPLVDAYLTALAAGSALPPSLFDYEGESGGDKPDPDTDFDGDDDKVETTDVAILDKGEATSGELGATNAESADLIDLDALRADARFANIDGTGYTVAVIDTGIDLDHPAFGSLRNGTSERIVASVDFTGEGDGTPNDVDGHGTNVASIIASENPDYLGVAPGSGIAALQALDNTGSGTFADIEQSLQWVIQNAAALDIVAVNLSLGATSNRNASSPASFGIADEFAALNQLGVVITVAAGNDYFSFQQPGTSNISADPNVLSIGAVWDETRSDVFWGDGAKDFRTAPDQITSFSQRADNPAIDTLLAPGAFIIGAAPGGGTSALGGTSQAAPHVAGLAALAQQIADEFLGRRLTPQEFEDVLRTGATEIFDAETGNDNVANTRATYDRVDALAMAEAILALDPDAPTMPAPPPPPSDTVPGDDSTEAEVVLGGSVDGSIDFARDTDWYQVDLVAGATYELALLGGGSGIGTLSDPLLNVFDQSGRLVATNDDGGQGLDSLLSLVAPSTGEFFVEARAYSMQTGSYRLAAEIVAGGDDFSADTGTTSLLSLGTETGGSIESLGDRDWHRLPTQAGQRYSVTLSGEDGGGGTLADPYLRVFDASGTLLGESDDLGSTRDARIVVEGVGGPLFVEATASADGGTGTYSVLVRVANNGGDIPGGTGTGATLAPGESAESTLGFLGDEDWFRVELDAGVRYDFAMLGTATGAGDLSDPLLRLHDASGTELAVNDDGGEGRDAALTFRPATAGTYYLNAGAYNGAGEGSYRLEMSRGQGTGGDIADDVGTSATLSIDQTVGGALETLGDADWYRVTLDAATSYNFTLQGQASGVGSLVDPYLRLYDATGTELTFDDDGGLGLESSLSFSPSESGTFYVSAESYQGRYEGTYEVAMAIETGPGGERDNIPNGPDTNADLPENGRVRGTLNFFGDEDWYAVTLEAGVEYTIDLLGAPSGEGTLTDPVLRLHERDGTLIASDDDGGTGFESRLVYTPETTEEVVIAAAGFAASQAGSFRIVVTGDGAGDVVGDTRATAQPIALDTFTQGIIEFGSDRDWYEASLTGGRRYAILVEGATSGFGTLSDPFLGLYDASGALIETDDNSGAGLDAEIVFAPATDKIVYVSAESFGGATGTYDVAVVDLGVEIDDAIPGGPTTPLNLDRGLFVRNVIDAPGDEDWVAVDLIEGIEYIFSMQALGGNRSVNLDPLLGLYDAGGALVDFDDDGGPGLDAQLTFVAETSGRYYVAASSVGEVTGPYALGMAYAEEDGFLANIAPGETLLGVIDRPGDEDWIRTELDGGTIYSVAVFGAGSGFGTLIDPVLSVHDVFGEQIAFNDDALGSFEPFLEFEAPDDGIYFLAISAFGGESDVDYVLSIA